MLPIQEKERRKNDVNDEKKEYLSEKLLTIEEHVVGQQLGSQHGDLLLRSELGLVLELDTVDIGVTGELDESGGQRGGLLLDDVAHVALLGLAVEEGRVELEAAAHLGPAAEEAGALNLAEGLVGVGLVLAAQVKGGDADTSEGGLDHRAEQLAGVQVVGSSDFLLGLVFHTAGVDVHTIAAEVEAHEGAQQLAGALVAATHAIVAHEGQQHGVGHVHVAHLALLASGIQAIPVVAEVLGQVLVVTVGSISGGGDVLSHLQSQRVIRSAAATIPVITDLIHAEEFSLGVVSDASVDGIGVLLLHARGAHTAVLGQELHMLSDGQRLCVFERSPVVRRTSSKISKKYTIIC